MKRGLFLTFCLLLLCACLIAQADVTPIIQDDADLLTDEEEQALLEVMAPICEYGTPMFWTTNESGNDRNLAANFYERKIGRGDGTVVVINMKNRYLTIYSDGAVKRVITASESDTISDNAYRYAGRGDYFECAKSMFTQIGARLRGERIAQPMKIVSNALLAVTLAMLFVYLYISQRYEQHSTTKRIKAAAPVSVLSAAGFSAAILGSKQVMTKQVKTDISSSSGSSGRGGGGHFGGGGGGFSGGHSGSSGGHRF